MLSYLYIQLSSVHESNTHYQDYCDLSFEPSVIAVHPDNSLDPDAAALSYGSNRLTNFVLIVLFRLGCYF